MLGAIEANGAAAAPRDDHGTPVAAGAIDEKFDTTRPIAAGAATIKLREAGDTGMGAGTASPAARKALAEAGVEPGRVAGTGKDGRITKADALTAVEGLSRPRPRRRSRPRRGRRRRPTTWRANSACR